MWRRRAAVVAGIAEGCRQAGCALIGGETAEMPGMYAAADYDLAGFAVGAVERGRILPRADVASGDVLIGLASSGVHSNGYSLVRRLVAEEKLAWTGPAPFDPATTLAEALLVPTRIYVKPVLQAIRATGAIKAIAHITGGGLSENLPRVLPAGLAAHVDLAAWKAPAVFDWLQRAGNLDDAEMLRTFNCGMGLVVVVARSEADAVSAALIAAGEAPVRDRRDRARPRRQIASQRQRRSRGRALLGRAGVGVMIASAQTPRSWWPRCHGRACPDDPPLRSSGACGTLDPRDKPGTTQVSSVSARTVARPASSPSHPPLAPLHKGRGTWAALPRQGEGDVAGACGAGTP